MCGDVVAGEWWVTLKKARAPTVTNASRRGRSDDRTALFTPTYRRPFPRPLVVSHILRAVT